MRVDFMTYFLGSISSVVSAVEERVVTDCRQPVSDNCHKHESVLGIHRT